METAMPLWAAILVALGGFTGIAGLIASISTAATSAKKTEIEALLQTINELQNENQRLRNRIRELESILGIKNDDTIPRVRKGLAL